MSGIQFKTDAEANDFKNKVANSALAFIQKETECLDGRTRWLIHGRVINALMMQHFGLSYQSAEKALQAVQEQANDTAP